MKSIIASIVACIGIAFILNAKQQSSIITSSVEQPIFITNYVLVTNYVWVTNYITQCYTEFVYEPVTAQCAWLDKNGWHTTNLIGFYASADYQTTYAIDLSNQGCQKISIGSRFPRLFSLKCWNNALTNLDVSQCSSLRILQCHDNQLNNIDVSHNYALQSLDCSVNNLHDIDVSSCTNLQYFNCYNMPISNINVFFNPRLRHIDFGGNPLTQENVSDILIFFDQWVGSSNGSIALFATSIPDAEGLRSATNLFNKGWDLQIDGFNP